MILNKCYFISWKPSEERLKVLDKAVAWAKEKSLEVYIIAMDWDVPYKYDVKWIKMDLKLPPGAARNVALSHFYSTRDDYCIILDDDTYIETGGDIIESIRSWTKEQLSKVDVLTVLESENHHLDLQESAVCHHFYPCPKITSGVFIVKNIRKFYRDKELYFNKHFVDYQGRLIFGEDVNFGFRTLYEGLGLWQVQTAMTNHSRDRDQLTSTWANNEDIFHPSNKLWNNAFIDINWKDFGTPKNGVGMGMDAKLLYEFELEPFRLKKC